MRDSFLVNGVAFKKTFSYAGFEQQPKKFLNPKILLLNIELELKSEKENAEIRYLIVSCQALLLCMLSIFSLLLYVAVSLEALRVYVFHLCLCCFIHLVQIVRPSAVPINC
jgi:hypothetical protein